MADGNQRGQVQHSPDTMRRTFPDLHITVTNLFACVRCALAELTLRGTYEPFTNGRGARAISWYGYPVTEVEGDKVARITLYAERLTILDQIDALPLAHQPSSANPRGFYYRRLEPVVPTPAPSPARHDGNGQAYSSPSGKE